MRTLDLTIKGMTCGHCVKAVTTALDTLPGVTAAKVSLSDGRAFVEYDENVVSTEDLTRAVEEEGYSVG